MNDASSNAQSTSRADLIRVLKEFPLTYEQHQVLQKPGIEILVHRVIRKRRWFTASLAVSATTCLALAVRGIAFASVVSPWIAASVLLGYWTYRRVKRSTRLRDAYQRFEKCRMKSSREFISLGDALRLSFSLDYDEHQAIRQGNDRLVADRMIERFNKDSAALALGGAGVSMIIWNRVGVHSIPFIAVLAVAVVACCLRNWMQVRRVEMIVGQHSETIISCQRDPLQALRDDSLPEQEVETDSSSRQTLY
ncbi:MAG: hypothetical protein ACF8AM_04580 [Rhodopirellula sp. JB055]|uniref:hypothetical protein n=1 Tax=Rhodopirellula sp. JB055 TaxID=3342846 RepID=UPI00370B5876